MKNRQFTKCAEAFSKDEKHVVSEIAEKISQDKMGGVIFFCSADYDLDKLAGAMDKAFSCPVIGCTSAGEIGSTYQNNGVVAVSLSSEMFRLHTMTIEPLNKFDFELVQKQVEELTSNLELSESLNPQKMFGFLLIDGLSVMEEPVTAALFSALKGVSIIGGSAGDSLNFKETKVYNNGKFISNAAVFTLIETLLPFKSFKLQHFVPSEKDMVITNADPSKRIVYEVDGGPAAEEYADIVGIEVKELSSQVFSMYPVMLQIGDEWYVRSIQKVNEDGSLTFFCAIDNGLPLTVAKGVGLVETLRKKVQELQTEFPIIEFTLGCDCILRRLEILEKNEKEEVEKELQKINFMGFSTFGEQYNSIHVNQTLTGVIIGGQTL